MVESLSDELRYVIRKFDQQISDLSRLGAVDEALEKRRNEHYVRWLESCTSLPDEDDPAI